jgi:hypothetical protein
MSDPAQPPPIGLVTCPNCQVEMPRISLKPLGAKKTSMKPSSLPQCATKTRRWIKSGKRLEQCCFESVG